MQPEHESSTAVGHGLGVPHELAEPLGRVHASLHNQHDARPLALPLVARLRDLLVRVAHHCDQHVHQQDRHDRHEHHEQNLGHRQGRITNSGSFPNNVLNVTFAMMRDLVRDLWSVFRVTPWLRARAPYAQKHRSNLQSSSET